MLARCEAQSSRASPKASRGTCTAAAPHVQVSECGGSKLGVQISSARDDQVESCQCRQKTCTRSCMMCCATKVHRECSVHVTEARPNPIYHAHLAQSTKSNYRLLFARGMFLRSFGLLRALVVRCAKPSATCDGCATCFFTPPNTTPSVSSSISFAFLRGLRTFWL